MKIVWNKIIPFAGFLAMTVIKWIFIREEHKGQEDTPMFQRMFRHESIHLSQILDFSPECFPDWLRLTIGTILFYPTYFIEWLIKCIVSLFTLFKVKAYESISYEQEAYIHENELDYLSYRKRFSWMKYIFKVVK